MHHIAQCLHGSAAGLDGLSAEKGGKFHLRHEF